MRPETQNGDQIEALINDKILEEHASLVAVGRKLWIIFEFFGVIHADSVSAQLAKLDCDIIGVGHIDGERMVAIGHRVLIRKMALTGGIAVGRSLSLNLCVGGHAHVVADRVLLAVRAWSRFVG